MSYVDCAIAPVPITEKNNYLAHASITASLFKKFGAISVMECWGDELPVGKLTSMALAVRLKESETVVLSLVVWPNKAARDVGIAAVMRDDTMQDMRMPFDGQRMFFGGFETLLEA